MDPERRPLESAEDCAWIICKLHFPSGSHVKLDEPWSRAGRQRDERKRLLAVVLEGAAREAHRREEVMRLCRERVLPMDSARDELSLVHE